MSENVVIGPQFAQQWTPIDELTSTQLTEEVVQWRNMWDWVNEEAKYFLTKIGLQVRIVKGNYSSVFGQLMTPVFTLKGLEVGVYEKTYDHNTGEYFWERKIVKLDAGRLIDMEFIHERVSWNDADETTLAAMLGEQEKGV